MTRTFPSLWIIFCIVIASCTVTNNLYVNDPEPLEEGEGQVYAGLSTGVAPRVDSVAADGHIFFSGKYSMAPVLSVGGAVNIKNGLQFRGSIHLPYIIGGIGLKGGVQYCFFPKGSRFNMSVGGDASVIFAKESIEIFGTYNELNPWTKIAFSTDIFVPFSVQVFEDLKLIAAPRYSFNFFFLRLNENFDNSKCHILQYPVLSIGLKFKKIYLEASGLYYNNNYHPMVGLAFISGGKK